MDDLLGLNEFELNNNSSCYFEEEDKKEELYIKMIEDRIMFKIRKEIIEPLISDFTIKTDINMCEILKLKDDISELKESLEKEKNKNIELSEEIDRLNYNYRMVKNEKNELKEYLTSMENNIKDNVTRINKISNIISKLKVYAPTCDDGIAYVVDDDFKDITTKKLLHKHQKDKRVVDWSTSSNPIVLSPMLDIKIFYNLEILHLRDINKVDFQYMYNDYLTRLILEGPEKCFMCDRGQLFKINILNLNELPSLKSIEFINIHNIDANMFIKEMSSYDHKIETIIFTNCPFKTNIHIHLIYETEFAILKSYCDENNIKLDL